MEFYRTALKMPAPAPEPPETDLAGWPLALHHLPEPERSAITLFYLEIFSPRVLSEILGLDIEELAQTDRRREEIARKSANEINHRLIVSMGQPLFSLLRPAYESTPELAALASQARAEIESSDTLKRQIEFDDQVAQELSSLKLTDSQVGALENLLSAAGPNANSETSLTGTSKPDETPAESSQNRSELNRKKRRSRRRKKRSRPSERARAPSCSRWASAWSRRFAW